MWIGPNIAGSLLAGMGIWNNANWIRMGDGMRALKIAVIVMGVLIVVGTIGLVVGIARRSTTPMEPVSPLSASITATLDEPAGTRIAGVAVVQNRLAVQLQGGGVDRIVMWDPKTGLITGRIALAR